MSSDARAKAEEALAEYDASAAEECDCPLDPPCHHSLRDDVLCRQCIPVLRALLAEPAPAPAPTFTHWTGAATKPDEAPAPAADAVAAFGARLLAEWWENDCSDLDGATVQKIAEETGLCHQVERHADGVECEWCGGEGPCGELTGAGLAALDARRRG